MGWVLGVDLGTTFTAAASWRDGHAEIISLGTRSAAIPSVVLFRDDGTVLTGDAAELRSVTEPEHVAREFKRRVGDSTPLLIAGSPRSPESLMAILYRAVVARAVEQEGSQPDRIAVTHPASWGEYKLDVLRQAIRLAELGIEPEFVPEPVAAAVHYATLARVELHDFVAVYDLGGGTFDAAVVRRTEDGFSIYGQPEGIERLGGIDVDAAVFAHVQSSLGLQLDTLDRDDPGVVSAFARLRSDCIAAKEALSSDSDAVIPVMLPGLASEVRITRGELETMIRPAITDSIAALRRAITSGKLVPEHIARVLLVGGSSRIPLVAEMVTAALGRPIALDSHPKHAVALGAAVSIAPKAAAITAPVMVAAPPPPPTTAPTPVWTPAPPPPPTPPATPTKRPPALIIAAIVGVLLLAAIAIAVTQSGGNDTVSPGTDASSDFTDFSDGLSPEQAKIAAENLVHTLFDINPGEIDTLKDRVLSVTTGALHDELLNSADAFSSGVEEFQQSSSISLDQTELSAFDGSFAVVTIDAFLTITTPDSDSATDQSDSTQSFTLKLVVNVEAVDGQFLASAISNCNFDSSDSFSFGFSNSDAAASC